MSFPSLGGNVMSIKPTPISRAERHGPGLAGALAIRRRRDPGPARQPDPHGGPQLDPPADAAEPYLTSLAKLFPAEAMSALLLVQAIDEQYETARLVLIGLIALASAALRYAATRDPQTGKPDILAIIVSVVSFFIYAAAMLAFGELFETNEPTTRIIATVAAILWMAILTAFVRRPGPINSIQ
jgi:hypothetical protein